MCTQEQLSVYLSQAVRSSCEMAQLRRAEWRRDTMYARELWRKVGPNTPSIIHTRSLVVVVCINWNRVLVILPGYAFTR